ncbi:MAG: hypothetical protein LWX83_16915 [Anaerolineae bacterium]|nr:hypothetical protein [Anaerolineae bacterium]
MLYAQFNRLQVSRFIVGSNPFSGFSHQSTHTDQEMKHYFTTTRIKQILSEAESLGINTLVARTDFHVMRTLMEYRDEGGRIQWFAQTCPEVGSHQTCIQRAFEYGALACHIHGGVMDNLFVHDKLEEVQPALDLIRQKGMLAGVAAHNPRVIEWAATHLDLDYYLCSYYNPIPRDKSAEHISGTEEYYGDEDRQAMTDLIPTLNKPVIHYKIMAAGRNEPAAAFAFAASKMRANDAVCVGLYPKIKPEMLVEDVRLLEQNLLAL